MDVASHASDLPADPAVVEITSDGNYSPAAFRGIEEAVAKAEKLASEA